jgi:hypothetical protein
MGEPLLFPGPISDVAGVTEYHARVTFGAGTVSTIRSLGITVTRPTATTLLLTFPVPYVEICGGGQFWAKATGADPLQFQVTTNAIATTGLVTLTSVSMNSAGVATAPADGDVLYLTVKVARDRLNDAFTSSTA